MPLLDHFQPPRSRTHPWHGFLGTWAAAMARLLNAGVLPPGYYAVPFLDREGPAEIDIATLPAAPELTVAVEWPSVNDVRVEVLTDDGDPQLAAAVELVSPTSKARTKARAAFVGKCAHYLERGCGVVVIDVVTTEEPELHIDMSTLLEVELPASALSALSYRSADRNGKGQLSVWNVSLAVGETMPTVPLWLGGDLAVPLDLEASHRAACDDLRIRQAG
jgi:hypothetical protein